MDREFLYELFEPFGAIDIKRMFGGFSLSADGLTFALVMRDALYLKADEETISWFELEGGVPFSYEAKGRPRVLTSYWQMPERLYDDPDETADWARAALAVARRAALKKASKTTAATKKTPAKTISKTAAKKKTSPMN